MDKKKILIAGLGNIGQVYQKVLKDDYDVYTLDEEKEADYEVIAHIREDDIFDLGIICVPNHLHTTFAHALEGNCKKLLIEKPGARTKEDWQNLIEDCDVPVIMVKNNMYHEPEDQAEIERLLSRGKRLEIAWIREDGVPKGEWQKDKELSFGGVEVDLLPHLLSVVVPYFLSNGSMSVATGRLDPTIFDNLTVGDFIDKDKNYFTSEVILDFIFQSGQKISLKTAWRNDSGIDSNGLTINGFLRNLQTGHYHRYEYKLSDQRGLCPDHIYKNMVDDVLKLDHVGVMWHNIIDKIIHEIIDIVHENS